MTRQAKERRVRALIDTWRVYLGLGNWAFDLRFDSSLPETASCTAYPEYRKAILRYNLKRLSEDELDDTTLHEMLHSVCWSIAALAGKWAEGDKEKVEVVRCAEELLVTHLTNVMLPLLPKVVTC